MGEVILSSVETLNIHVPVTAVYFVGKTIENKQFLLSGSGGFVSVFDISANSNYSLLSVVNVLGSRNIHGFGVKEEEEACCSDDLKICAFGERFVAIFKLREDILKEKRVPKTPCCFGDRVLDVRWLTKQPYLAVLLAHNEFQLVDPTSCQVVKSVRCEQNSVLFSGLIVDTPISTPFVVAGACLGYLYLWQPLENPASEKVQIQLNLSNAGGVFCAAAKPDDWQSLAIVCEDRGIYVFKVDVITSKKIETLQTLFGHSARIWKVAWADKHLVSAGEDSQILLWDLTNSSVIHRFQSISNTNFFALTVDPLNSNRMAAGLSDGSVRLYNVKLSNEDTEIPGDDPAVRVCDQTEHVVCLRFISTDTLFYVSNSGKLALIHLGDNSNETLDNNPHYSMAVVLASKPIDKNRALIGLAHGVPSELNIFEVIRTFGEWKLNKLAEFRSPALNMPRAYLLAFLADNQQLSKLFVSNFDVAANCVFNINGTKVIEFNLRNAKVPTPSSGTQMHFDKIAITCGLSVELPNKMGELFVFGDNCGSVLVAKKAGPESTEAVFTQVFAHLHGRDGCHSLSYSASDNTVISCGGASSVSFFRLNSEQLSHLNTIKPCSSLDFTVLYFANNSKEYVSGFAQKSFMVSAIQPSQLTLTKHYCSGRKREWDIFFNANEPLSLKFAYVRAGQAYMVPVTISETENSREVGLQCPLHGLRINECKFIAHLTVSNSFVFILASEDDTSSIVAFEERHGTSLHVLHRLAGHVSGVRCVQVMRQSADEMKFLLLTGGSRGIAIAWTLTLANAEIADLKKSTMCRKIAQISLTNQPISSLELPRSSQTQLDNVPKGSWRQSKVFGPPLATDMRFMDITAISPTTFDHVFVVIACSDATVRLFELNTTAGNVATFNRVLCLSEGLSFCQLRVAFTSIKNDSGVIVSGDTGGQLNFWHWPTILSSQDDVDKPVSVRIHQSGINGLHIAKISDVFDNQDSDEPLIAFTGGDDTAIVVSKLFFENPKLLHCTELLRINSAHSSQISGLSFMRSVGLIITVSIDQRVRFWKFSTKSSPPDDGEPFSGGFVSCVADCSSLAVAIRDSNYCAIPTSSLLLLNSSCFMLVVGEGCQFIKVHFK